MPREQLLLHEPDRRHGGLERDGECDNGTVRAGLEEYSARRVECMPRMEVENPDVLGDPGVVMPVLERQNQIIALQCQKSAVMCDFESAVTRVVIASA